MKSKLVVMGGSFNPPTLAHFRLMQEAVNSINASTGIFVPACDSYVRKKLKKLRCQNETLSESLRLEMLDSFCVKDSRFNVSKIQISKQRFGRDLEMLEDLQEIYPECEIYFVTGSDKLGVLPRWHRINDFLAKFRILVAKRGEDNLEEIRAANPHLSEIWHDFSVFPVPDEIANISSSIFRDKLRNNDETAKDLVTPEVWEIMNKNGKIPWNTIDKFRDEYDFLSNFYESEITFEGLTYGSNEAAFQAQKCMTHEEKLLFTDCRPAKSKSLGRSVNLRPDWESVKVGLMTEIIRAKFTQHSELAAKLVATGEKIIIEGNTWGDIFWGIDTRTGQGENHLGKILMRIRDELRSN